jgi:hypothetical protein
LSPTRRSLERTKASALDTLASALGLDADARTEVEQAAAATIRSAGEGAWGQALLLENQLR